MWVCVLLVIYCLPVNVDVLMCEGVSVIIWEILMGVIIIYNVHKRRNRVINIDKNTVCRPIVVRKKPTVIVLYLK